MSSASSAPRPDTSDMIAVHNAFRSTLGDAPALINGAAGDPRRAAVIGSFYGNVLEFLHSHHSGEDELVTPLLVERALAEVEVVQRVAAQHHDVVSTVGRAEAMLPGWSAGADASQGRELAGILASLDQQLTPHLDEEERAILPLCAEHLTCEEWGALPGHAMGTFRGDKIWLILGLIRESMTEAQRQDMLAHMPPPAVEMWTTMGERSYDELVAEVRAGL